MIGRLAVSLVATSLTVAGAARAEGVPGIDGRAIRWRPQEVVYPAGDAFAGAALGATTAGPVTLSRGRAATFHLAGAELARVTPIAGTASALRIRRVVAEGGAGLVADDLGVAGAGGARYLIEPLGDGALWRLEADAPVTVTVEFSEPRRPWFGWDEARERLLAGGAGDLPDAESEALAGFAAGLAIVRRLAGVDPATRAAVDAWGAAAIEREVALRWPVAAGLGFRRDLGDRLGGRAEVIAGVPVRRVAAAGRAALEVDGPGTLVVELRAAAPGRELALELRSGDRALASRRATARPVSPPRLIGGRRTARRGPPLPGPSAPLRVELPLAEAHRLTLRWSGGELLRATLVERRPRLAQALAAGEPILARLRAARRDLARTPVGEPRRAAEALVARALGAPLASPLAAGPLGLIAAVHGRGGDPVALAERIAALPADLDPLADVLARALIDDRAPGAAAAAALAGRATLSPTVHAALAERLADGDSPARQAALAHGEAAFLARPQATWARRAYLAGWRATRWQRLDPVRGVEVGGAARRLLAVTLAPDGAGAPAVDDARAGDPVAGRLVALPLDSPTPIALAPAADRARLAVLRVLAIAAPAAGVPLSLEVDGASYRALALDRVTRLEVAVAPGEHRVRIGGPPGTLAFVRASQVGAIGAPASAVVRTLWPAAVEGRPLEYALPRGARVARLELRTVGGAARRRVRLGFDVGAARELELLAGPLDPAAASIDGGPVTTGGAMTLWLPPLARRVRVEADPDVLVALSIRAADIDLGEPAVDAAGAVAPPSAGPPLPTDPALAQVASLSRRLAADPGHTGARIARASALVALGMRGAARRDLEAALGDGALLDAALRAVAGELDEGRELYYLARQPAASRLFPGAPLAPAHLGLLAAGDAAELAPIAALAARSPTAALEALARHPRAATPGGRALRGELRARAGDREGAALDLLAERAHPAAAIAGLDLAGDELARPGPPRALAAIAFGAAAELTERLEHVTARRALALAARATRAVPLRGTDAAAGFESVLLAADERDETPAARVKRALAGWPAPASHGHLLGPGEHAALAVHAAHARALRIEATCARPPTVAPPCRFAITGLPGEPRQVEVDAGRSAELLAGALPPGRHEVRVALDRRDRAALAVVSFALGATAERAEPVAIVRPAELARATAARPVAATVAGPATVLAELRALDAGATSGRIDVVAPDGATRTVTAALPADVDPGATGSTGRALALRRPAELTLVLPAGGPHRLAVRPDGGAVAVRLRLRLPAPIEDAEAALISASALRRELDLALTTAAASEPAPLVVTRILPGGPARRPGPLTVSGELIAGRDDLTSVEADEAASRSRVELLLEARRRDGDRWILASIGGRMWRSLDPTFGARLAARQRGLPGGLLASGDLAGYVQGDAVGLHALARAERPLTFDGRLAITPGLGLLLRRYRGGDDPPGDGDPRADSAYGRAHARVLTPRLTAAFRPFPDQQLGAAIELRTNDDLASTDQVIGRLRWRGLIELAPRRGPLAELSYRPIWQLEDRDRAANRWRHQVGAELAFSLLDAADRVRLATRLEADLAARDGGLAVWLALRWDRTAGRGLGDFTPIEEPFGPLLEARRWDE